MKLLMTRDEIDQHKQGREREEAEGYGDTSDYLRIRTGPDGARFTYLAFRHYDIKVEIVEETP